LLYSMFKAAGVVSDDELVNGYRRFGSPLQGHPTPVLPGVDVATGSLGQGLPDGVGVALAGRYLDELPYRVWVLCSDSEMAEGSMWEAFDKAAYYRLDNLTAIADVNRLGQRGPTELGWDLDAYARRVEAFGCRAIPIDGHDLGEIDKALTQAAGADRPTVILARTRKGRGFSEVEDREAGTAGRCPPRWPSGPSSSWAGHATSPSAGHCRRVDRCGPGPAARAAHARDRPAETHPA
jgi:transketolase